MENLSPKSTQMEYFLKAVFFYIYIEGHSFPSFLLNVTFAFVWRRCKSLDQQRVEACPSHCAGRRIPEQTGSVRSVADRDWERTNTAITAAINVSPEWLTAATSSCSAAVCRCRCKRTWATLKQWSHGLDSLQKLCETHHVQRHVQCKCLCGEQHISSRSVVHRPCHICCFSNTTISSCTHPPLCMVPSPVSSSFY